MGLEALSLNDIVSKLSDWLRAISRLRGQGMPEGQCKFVFGGTEPSLLQRIWNGAKTVAALQEAILKTPEEGPLPNHHFLFFWYPRGLLPSDGTGYQKRFAY